MPNLIAGVMQFAILGLALYFDYHPRPLVSGSLSEAVLAAEGLLGGAPSARWTVEEDLSRRGHVTLMLQHVTFV